MSGVNLQGVHLLLTYKCLYECDHCFVWSSPSSQGTMTLPQMEDIIRQAHEIPSVKSVSFEGGEPFLFYPVMLRGVQYARDRGLEVGIVSNAYWATSRDDSKLWLQPMAERGISDLSLSADEYHGSDDSAKRFRVASAAAKELSVPVAELKVRGMEYYSCDSTMKRAGGDLYFRGRAAEKLADKAPKKPWATLTKCPEDPPAITRVHVDALGNVQFCQGITIGNVWRRPLRDIMARLDPERHPVIGPLIRGGPAQLAREAGVRPAKAYADSCHMCYEVRKALRRKGVLRGTLRPDQVYGEGGTDKAR
jgi:hypothetical protein